MIYAISSFKNLFSCFTPTINALSRLFKKIFCHSETQPVKPLNSDRVKVISPEETPSALIPKNIVSDRVNSSYKRNREIQPSSSDANVFCGVIPPDVRTFNLESEKRKRVMDKIRAAQNGPTEEEQNNLYFIEIQDIKAREEKIKNSPLRNKLLRDLQKLKEGPADEERNARYEAEYEKKQQCIKKAWATQAKIKKQIIEAHDLDPSMPEFVYNQNGFIYLRAIPEERKNVSKESIAASYNRFKEHCKKHQSAPVAAEVDEEQKKVKAAEAHATVLNHINSKRTSGSVNFVYEMSAILAKPNLKVFTESQVQCVNVKKRFLADLKNALSHKKTADPLIAIGYFRTEFAQTALPIGNEKLREWRMKLNSLMDARFESLKEGILKLITLQTTYSELSDYSINTRQSILNQSNELLENLRIYSKFAWEEVPYR